ncbi:MAG: hypothetical protein ACFE7E_08390 [Candidatus Hodarchaeota archaeon]
MDLLIEGGTVITMNEENVVLKNGVVVIENDSIVDVGSSKLARKYPRYEKIDAKGKLILPSLINCHTHAAMTPL